MENTIEKWYVLDIPLAAGIKIGIYSCDSVPIAKVKLTRRKGSVNNAMR
jgi:hypothetical protein